MKILQEEAIEKEILKANWLDVGKTEKVLLLSDVRHIIMVVSRIVGRNALKNINETAGTAYCVDCKLWRSVTDFHAFHARENGCQPRCKDCSRLRERLRNRNRDRKEYHKQYAVKVKERIKYQHKAHNIVASAIANGTLIKQPCEVCQVVDVEAHHSDYSKPLSIIWLCKQHHAEYDHHLITL